jgi:hypothetical protein
MVVVHKVDDNFYPRGGGSGCRPHCSFNSRCNISCNDVNWPVRSSRRWSKCMVTYLLTGIQAATAAQRQQAPLDATVVVRFFYRWWPGIWRITRHRRLGIIGGVPLARIAIYLWRILLWAVIHVNRCLIVAGRIVFG